MVASFSSSLTMRQPAESREYLARDDLQVLWIKLPVFAWHRAHSVQGDVVENISTMVFAMIPLSLLVH